MHPLSCFCMQPYFWWFCWLYYSRGLFYRVGMLFHLRRTPHMIPLPTSRFPALNSRISDVLMLRVYILSSVGCRFTATYNCCSPAQPAVNPLQFRVCDHVIYALIGFIAGKSMSKEFSPVTLFYLLCGWFFYNRQQSSK